jgi:radical SAM superfamily enzyme YgiQ (UPF0313 family)
MNSSTATSPTYSGPAAPDVVLVVPPFDGEYFGTRYENQGIAQLAAILREHGWRVATIDAFMLHLDCEEVADLLRESPPRLMLGFTAIQHDQYRSLRQILDLLPESSLPLVAMGGYFPSLWFRDILADERRIDAVFRYESDLALPGFLIKLAAGRIDDPGFIPSVPGCAVRGPASIVDNGPGPIPQDLGALPLPAHDHIRRGIILGCPGVIHSSRGCDYGRCAFCCIGKQYPDEKYIRRRPVAQVVREIDNLATEGAEIVLFSDDNFLNRSAPDDTWVDEFIKAMDGRGSNVPLAISTRPDSAEPGVLSALHRVGLRSVFLGIENISARTLRIFSKGITPAMAEDAVTNCLAAGLCVIPGYIMFEPRTTVTEIRQGIAFMQRHRVFGRFYFNVLTVLPGTPLAERYARQGILRRDGFRLLVEPVDPDVRALADSARLFTRLTNKALAPTLAAWFPRLKLAAEHDLAVPYDEILDGVRERDLQAFSHWCDLVEAGARDKLDVAVRGAAGELVAYLAAADLSSLCDNLVSIVSVVDRKARS